MSTAGDTQDSVVAGAALAPQEERVIARVRDGTAELLGLVGQLVAFDTTSREQGDPPRDEVPLQALLASHTHPGHAVDLWEPEPTGTGNRFVPDGLNFQGRPQLLAHLPGRDDTLKDRFYVWKMPPAASPIAAACSGATSMSHSLRRRSACSGAKRYGALAMRAAELELSAPLFAGEIMRCFVPAAPELQVLRRARLRPREHGISHFRRGSARKLPWKRLAAVEGNSEPPRWAGNRRVARNPGWPSPSRSSPPCRVATAAARLKPKPDPGRVRLASRRTNRSTAQIRSS